MKRWRLSATDLTKVVYQDKTGRAEVMVARIEPYEYEGPVVMPRPVPTDVVQPTEPFSVGQPPLFPSSCALCRRDYVAAEGVTTCPRCKAPLTVLTEENFKYVRQLGRLFIPLGKPKQVGPITCPVCKGRTVKRYLDKFQMCARCKKVKDASEKKANKVPAPVLADTSSRGRYRGRGRDLLRSSR